MSAHASWADATAEREGRSDAGSLYVGDDWLLYVDASAQYPRSETIAPCLMLAQPGHAMVVEAPAGPLAPATGWLHAAGTMTACDEAAGGAAFLYFDPLSEAGRALQGLCAEAGSSAWTPETGDGWSADWFAQLAAGSAPAAAVSEWVALQTRRLAASLPAARVLDRRLRTVAEALISEPSGRLSLPQFAQQVHCSPEHLRKTFRVVAGMTMSRYQMWRRLHRMSLLSCPVRSERRVEFAAPALTALQDAGFYDGPHGCRVIRRYYGLTATSALGPAVRHARCG
jgi:AraC-like DNA-binding protein